MSFDETAKHSPRDGAGAFSGAALESNRDVGDVFSEEPLVFTEVPPESNRDALDAALLAVDLFDCLLSWASSGDARTATASGFSVRVRGSLRDG